MERCLHAGPPWVELTIELTVVVATAALEMKTTVVAPAMSRGATAGRMRPGKTEVGTGVLRKQNKNNQVKRSCRLAEEGNLKGHTNRLGL